MSKEESLFNEIGNSISDAVKGQLFGKPCYKIGKKAFSCFFLECMVFKLNEPYHTMAMKLEGAKLFDPSAKNRPMKEWVQLPYTHHSEWHKFAEHAKNYIQESQ